MSLDKGQKKDQDKVVPEVTDKKVKVKMIKAEKDKAKELQVKQVQG